VSYYQEKTLLDIQECEQTI